MIKIDHLKAKLESTIQCGVRGFSPHDKMKPEANVEVVKVPKGS